MQRDAEATKRRLIAAGQAEFAAYGLNGARVDRIADAAQCNKAQIYHYFKNKAGLFEAVWSELVEYISVNLYRDVRDLPEVAARLADIYAERPEYPRLITWQRMERGDEPPNELGVNEVRARCAAIAEAQAQGIVSTRFEATVLQTLMIHLAMMWEASAVEVLVAVEINDQAQRREIVRRVVAALVE